MRPGRALQSWIVCALLAACGSGDSSTSSTDSPSLILISIDALRRDHLGLYGYERETSPRLDRLARECVVFDRAYATAPWTLISHMTMLTGLFPAEHGVLADGTQLSSKIPTLAQRLKERDYYTVAVYLPGWIHERFGYDRGFDSMRPYEFARSKSSFQSVAREVIADLPTDRPFFLFLHIWDVHCGNVKNPLSTIYDPPAPYDTMFVADARARLVGLEAEAVFRGELPATSEQREAIDALYDGGIRYVDDYLGEWIDEWRASGLLDDTVLVITSDHGEELGQREGVGGHGAHYEEGLRVPLLVRYPDGRDAGRRRSELVSHVDLVPTMLDLLGLPAEDWLPGHPLHGALPNGRILFVDRPPTRAIIAYPWKLAWKLPSGPEHGVLYNLADDPDELEPLRARSHPETFNRLQKEMTAAAAALRASWGQLPGTAEAAESGTEAELDALRALGYLGDD